MRTVKEMVDYFGSQNIAERLGVTNQTVSNWVTSNYISMTFTDCLFYQLLKEFKYPNPSLVELNELKPIKK